MPVRRKIGTPRVPALIEALAPFIPTDELQLEAEAGRLGLAVEVKAIKLKRSVDQNDRYWAIVTAIAQAVGDTKEGVHEDLLCEFHGYDVIVSPITKLEKRIPRGRSHNLSTSEFSELMELAERTAAFLGVDWEEEAA